MNKLKYLETGTRPVLDVEQTHRVEQLLNQKFVHFLSFGSKSSAAANATQRVQEKFSVESGCSKEQCQLRITLERSDRSLVYPVETVVLVDAVTDAQVTEGEQFLNLVNAMIDFQDAYWTEYFENDRDTFVPIDWSEHHYLGHKIFVRGEIRNALLEDQANELLQTFGFGDHDIAPLSEELKV